MNAGLSSTAMAWQDRAACRGHENPDLWFADDPVEQAEAKAICGTCPVRLHCLIYQARFTGTEGIWGGRSGHGLKNLRKELREAA